MIEPMQFNPVKDPIQIVVHPEFRDLILSGRKVAAMISGDFYPDHPIEFFTIDKTVHPPVEKIFATATSRKGQGLFIDAKTETMKKAVGGQQWVKLTKEQVRRVIFNEGFDHPDSFWSSMWKRNIKFYCNQVYWENVKPTSLRILK